MLLKNISLIVVLLLASKGMYAQKATIKGIITDERETPIVHALVADEATGLGIYTDCNGTYSLEVNAGENITFIYYSESFKAVRRNFLLAPGAVRVINVQLEKLLGQEGLQINIAEVCVSAKK